MAPGGRCLGSGLSYKCCAKVDRPTDSCDQRVGWKIVQRIGVVAVLTRAGASVPQAQSRFSTVLGQAWRCLIRDSDGPAGPMLVPVTTTASSITIPRNGRYGPDRRMRYPPRTGPRPSRSPRVPDRAAVRGSGPQIGSKIHKRSAGISSSQLHRQWTSVSSQAFARRYSIEHAASRPALHMACIRSRASE